MKKLVILAVLVCFVFSAMPAVSSHAQGKSGVSSSSIADDSAIDKIGDWFATRGKSDAEKQKMLAERKMKRVAERAQKKAERGQKEAQKQMQKQKKEMNKSMKQMQKGLR